MSGSDGADGSESAGNSLGPPREQDGGDDQKRQAGRLLSRANLLRIRGQYEEAVALCREALALTPGDAAACALIGDLFEAQGRHADALPWHAMAADAAPENPLYREKLTRLAARRKSALEKNSPAPGEAPEPDDPAVPLKTTAKASGSERAARLIWLLSGGVLFALLLVALWLLRPVQKETPKIEAPSPAFSSAPQSAASTPKPENPVAPTPSASPSPTGVASRSAGVMLRFPSGVAYLNPATGLAVCESPAPSTRSSREDLLREALRLAADISRADVRVKTIQVRLSEPGAARPALLAEIGAIDAIRVSPDAAGADLFNAFLRVEWGASRAPGRQESAPGGAK